MDRFGLGKFASLCGRRLGRVNRLRYCLLLIFILGPALRSQVWGHEDKLPPPPHQLELETADGVQLSAIYYEGTEGAETVPVVVIHDWDEEGTDFEILAEYLQEHGYAVILPDLRGHGNSTVQKSAKHSRTLNSKSVIPMDIVRQDLEAVRKFLLKENNQEKLNLNNTCLVGVGTGAILATYYAIWDWDPYFRYPNPSNFYDGKRRVHVSLRGGKKDVKALVLISPENRLKNLQIDALWRHHAVGTSEISTLILFGEKQDVEDKKKPRETREAKTANTIYRRIQPNHEAAGEDVGKWTLFFKTLDTELNGKTMVNETNLELGARADIRAFINLRLRDRPIAWKGKDDRPRP